MTTKDSGLYRVGTPEKAQKILSKLVKDGKITVQDLDQESPGAAYTREIATKYYPEIKLKPHVNLLRTNEPVQEIKVSEERDFSPTPRSEPSVSRERSPLLLQDSQEDRALVNINDLPW